MGENYYGLWAIGILAIVMLFIGAGAIDKNGDIRLGQGDPVARPTIVQSGAGDEILITESRGGSFLTEIIVDGAYVDVLVDTGASYTTLTEEDAQDAGILPSPNEYLHTFSTANGEVKAAKGLVRELELGPAVLEDVTVFVIPDGKLEISLLGMNVLRQFDRMEMTSEGLKLAVN